ENDLLRLVSHRFDAFTDYCGYHVRALKVEVIAGPVKVNRQKVNGIKAVLCAIRGGLHQHHFFGETVRCVRLFRVSVPEIFLAEGDWSEFRVSTNCADGYKLLHT